MEYSKLPNPYDFANPVTDPNLFAGRKPVLDEICYYLDHAEKAPRAINLAIIGGRASGKTSILNMIHKEAERREFCVVRVELDESDGQSQLIFFHKIFDGIITTACIAGIYGGIHGATYDNYRTVVDSYGQSGDRESCPFIFPFQYAKAMNVGNISAQLSDVAFKSDISHIQETIQKPIIIVMDECDVLGRSRVHLEKLRNIFMNTRGFMLVLTGTEALFPLIDDVFSPIIRQFKIISVRPFDKEEETKECVEKPLQNLDIEPYDILDMETLYDIPKIHDLSSGRPYEIQLLCHLLFRRVQQGRVEQMSLTSDVLDEVLDTLQSSHDKTVRPSINKIRSLEKEQLSALGVLCYSNTKATFEQAWFIEYLIHGISRWTQEALSDNLRYLKKVGLITVDENGVISFVGDDFDLIYCKYYSRKHGVNLNIDNGPPDVNAGFYLRLALSEKLDFSRSIFLGDTTVLDSDIQDMVSLFLMEDDSQVTPLKNPFSSYPILAYGFYERCFEYFGKESYQLMSITITSPWYKIRNFLTYDFPNGDPQAAVYGEKINSWIQELRDRATQLDGNIEYEIHILPVLAPDILTKKLATSNIEPIKRRAFSFHYRKVLNDYIGEKNRIEALVHGQAAINCGKPESGTQFNNLGYLFMSLDKLDIAKPLLESSIAFYEDDPDVTLPEYNLAILLAKQNMLEDSLKLLKKVREKTENISRANSRCACLFVPTVDFDGNVEYTEIFDPYLLEIVNSAITVFETIIVERDVQE